MAGAKTPVPGLVGNPLRQDQGIPRWSDGSSRETVSHFGRGEAWLSEEEQDPDYVSDCVGCDRPWRVRVGVDLDDPIRRCEGRQ